MPCFFYNMSILNRIILTATGVLFAIVLQSAVTWFITNFIIPSRNLFGFGSGLIFIVIFITALWVIVYSVALTFSDSLVTSLIISLLFSIWMTWKTFQSAIEVYRRPDYFDRDFFTMDVIQICANFVIYPLTAVLIWILKKKFVTLSD